MFAELMEWLDGHPLSMRLTLPLLDTTAPETLLAGLRGTTPLTTATPDGGDGAAGGDRGTSLPACVTYSFTSPRRAHPPAAGGGVPVPRRRRRRRARRCSRGWSGCRPGLRGVDADGVGRGVGRRAQVGLLTPLGAGMYGIHPALPGYLAGAWRAD